MDWSPHASTIERQILAFGLPEKGRTDRAAIPKEIWPGLVSTLSGQRCTGLAMAGVESGWLQLSSDQMDDLLDRHRQLMLQTLGLERRLLAIAGAFDGAAVEFVVLKGSALAHTVYPDPSWRSFGDLDILVRTEDWRKASSILRDLGLPRALPEPRPRFDERFGKASVHGGGGDIQVDLHRTLVLGAFGLWIEPDRLFDHTVEFRLGGRSLRRFDDTMLLLHACMHASLGLWPPLTLPVRDVAQVAWFGEIDWDQLVSRARQWRLGVVAQHAFRMAEEMLGVPMPETAKLVEGIKPRRRERRALEAYTTERRRRGGTARGALVAIPGLRAKLAYLFGLLFPSRSFLAARKREGQTSYWRRWMVAAQWFAGRRTGSGSKSKARRLRAQ